MISFLKFLRFLGPLTLFFATFVILPPLAMQAFASQVEIIFLSIFIFTSCGGGGGDGGDDVNFDDFVVDDDNKDDDGGGGGSGGDDDDDH